ncbi:MAG: UDP-N-acetylmuramoyl-tripeptide--D-alanyl-D-alanine ligase [Saprospiraceae bacterium]
MEISELYKIFTSCENVSTDTRTIKENDLFFGLKGANFDGNRFVAKAFENGATYAVIDNPEFKINEQCILVEDSLVTLQELSKYHRQQLTNLKLIAIVGSNGKTTTKELLHSVLASKYKTYSTYKNFNNEIGVPLNLLWLDETYDFAVIELGANHIGEHEFLCNIALPDFGIVTNCGKDHLEGYGSIEGVIQSNKELFDFFRDNGGIAFVNADDQTLFNISNNIERVFYGKTPERISGKQVQTGSITEKFPFININIQDNKTLKTNTFEIKSHLFGSFQLFNIMSAVTIGRYFDVEEDLIKNAIENYIPDNNRSQIISWKENTVLLDAYNANPSSMLPMIEDFDEFPHDNKIVVLGDMYELGETEDEEHKAMVLTLQNRSFKEVIIVGELFGKHKKLIDCQHFMTSNEVATYLNKQNYKNHYFLAKGSRGMKIEKAFL